jgi:hypothetical protein
VVLDIRQNAPILIASQIGFYSELEIKSSINGREYKRDEILTHACLSSTI